MTQTNTQTVYGIMRDQGDGSAVILWFQNGALARHLVESDDYCESFWANEGCISETFTFPADLDLKTCGFSFDDKQYAHVKIEAEE